MDGNVEIEERYRDVERLVAPDWLAPKLIGPYIAGYLVTLYLSGVFTQNCVTYFLSPDFRTLAAKSRASRNVLFALCALNGVYMVLVWEEAYGLAVRQDRTVAKIIEASYQWNMLPLIAGYTGALAQAFLAARAGRFIDSRKLRYAFYGWMSFLILLVLVWSTAVCGLGFIFNIKGGEWDLPLDWNTSVAIWLSSAAAGDLSLSLALAWSLRARIRGFSHETDHVVKKLIYVALRTAAYTAVVSIAGAIVASIWSDGDYESTDVNISFWLVMPPLYGLSFFSTISSSRAAVSGARRTPPQATTTRAPTAKPGVAGEKAVAVRLDGAAQDDDDESAEKHSTSPALPVQGRSPSRARSPLPRVPLLRTGTAGSAASAASSAAGTKRSASRARGATGSFLAGAGGGGQGGMQIAVTTQVEVEVEEASAEERDAEKRMSWREVDDGAYDGVPLYPARSVEAERAAWERV